MSSEEPLGTSEDDDLDRALDRDLEESLHDDVPAGEVRLIKRYANRKLYDTSESRYVTLQQVAEFIRQGEDVRIIDNQTKEELTSITLAQIIYEEQKSGVGRQRNARTLKRLIQRGGERLITSLREGKVGKIVQNPRDELGLSSRPPGPRPGGKERRSVFMQSKDALDELSHMADDRMRALLGAAVGPIHYLQMEAKRLQVRIDELEDKLRTLSERPRRPSGSPGTESGSPSEGE